MVGVPSINWKCPLNYVPEVFGLVTSVLLEARPVLHVLLIVSDLLNHIINIIAFKRIYSRSSTA